MPIELTAQHGVRLAIEGCGHGTLHAIYASVAETCKRANWPGVDLLIIGGDFQAVRNGYELNCVSMPAKYRQMCDFHEYYSGQRKAPYLTIFVGGNHEASNYLFELYYGGWVAPNIYYLGAANVVRLGPLRVAGLSGIWKGYNYRKPHFERLPYNESDMKSIYHVRELDARKLMQIRSPVDVGISHDWPRGVEWKGKWKQLFAWKKHFEEDARNGQLGNIAAQQIMDWIRPRYWFSAHLHVKYAALVEHEENRAQSSAKAATKESAVAPNQDEINLDDEDMNGENSAPPPKNGDEIDLDMDEEDSSAAKPGQAVNGDTVTKNSDEIDLDLDDESVAPPIVQANPNEPATMLSEEAARAALPDSFRRNAESTRVEEPVERPPAITNTETQFLALDKCLPGRHFLQLMSVPSEGDLDAQRPLKLAYDREWLSITRSFALNEPLVVGDQTAEIPRAQPQSVYYAQIDEQRSFIDDKLRERDDLIIPENFEVTAPVYDGGNWNLPQYKQIAEWPNPQTATFCEMLRIPNPFDISEEERNARLQAGPREDPEAERFAARGRGRGGFGQHRGGRGGRGGHGGRGRGRGQFRGR